MCLGIARFRKCDAAYSKAVALDGDDYMTHLNFAVTLANCGEKERSKEHLAQYKKLLKTLDEDALSNMDDDVTRMAKHLDSQLRN